MLKCTKIDFGWGFAYPAGRAYSERSPRLSSWNKGDLLLKEGEGCRVDRERGRRKGEGRGRDRREGKEREGGERGEDRGDSSYQS